MLEISKTDRGNLADEEERFRAITQAIPVPFLISRATDSVILYANEHFGRLIGAESTELIGRKALDFYFDPAERQTVHDTLEKEGFLHLREFRAKRANGQSVWVAVSIQPLEFRDERAYLAGFYDVTDRKNAEAALREAHDELERKIRERTEDLSEANERLELEIEERIRAETAQTEQLQFERLITDLSHRFADLPVGDIDQAITSSLQKVVELFGVDRGTLFRISADQKQMQAVSTFTAEGAVHVPEISAYDLFPYTWPKILSGEPFAFSSLDELPEEAAVDRESFVRLQVKSNVAITVKVGAVPGYVLSLGASRKERPWERELIPRIQLVGELLVGGLQRKQAEAKLRETELKYRTVADFTYDWEYWTNPDRDYLYVSPACERISGYKPRDFINDPFLLQKIILPDDRETWSQHTNRAYETLQPSEVQFRIRSRDDEIIWIEHACQPVEGPDGVFLGLRSSNRDISERKRDEEVLRESEQSLAEAQRTAHMGNWKWDIVKDEVNWSPELYRILDVDPEMKPSRSAFLERLHPEDRFLVEERIAALLSENEPFSIDHRVVLTDGAIRSLHSTASTERNEANEPVRMYGICQDITERKKSEEELKVKDSAIESSINAVGIADPDGRLVYVNDSCVRMWGFKNREEIIGKFLPEFWEGDGILKTVEELREKGGAIGEDVARRKDGSLFDVQFSASMIRDEAGQPIFMYGSFMDISERKRAEKEISDRLHFEQLLAGVSREFVNLPAYRTDDAFDLALKRVSEFLGVARSAVFEYDDEDNSVRCTHQWLKPDTPPPKAGKSMNWMENKQPASDRIHANRIDDLPEDAADHKNYCKKLGIQSFVEVPLLAGGLALGKAVFLAERSQQEWPEELVQRLRLIGEILASALARQRAEEEVRRFEERYSRASLAGRVGVWDWNLETNEIYVDPRLKALLGYKDHEIRNHIDDWGGRIHPGDADQVMAEATKHLEGITPRYEIEHRMVHKDGTVRWFMARGTALRNESGHPYRMTGTDTDITPRKSWREKPLSI